MSAGLATGGAMCSSAGMATDGHMCSGGGVIILVSVVIDLQGVVEDGGPPAPNLPANPRRAVRVRYGETVTFRLALFHRSGAPFDLTVGAPSIELVARDAPGGTVKIRETATLLPAEGKNRADIVVLPADYTRLRPTGERLVYDVFLSDGGVGRAAVIPLSSYIIEAAANPLP